MKRRLLIGAVLACVIAGLAAFAAVAATPATARAAYPAPHPTVSDFQFIKATTPTEADCEAVGRTCFTPQAIQSAYNVGPLYAQGWNGKGMTIAIVDSYGSDTMAHDLHVFDQAFGLQPMCGEEGVTCTAGMPKFSELAINGSPETKPQPGNGTHLEDKAAWALEVALDVETSHAIAPQANILLVHSNNAETLGVQGFPNMMKAEDYVVKNHLANVISQSFASSEDAFGSKSSLLNLRYAFQDAAANGVTVLGSSGDDGSTNFTKSPVSKGGSLIPHRQSSGRPRIRSSPASAAPTCAPIRPRRRISRGHRMQCPPSARSAPATARSTPVGSSPRSRGRSPAAASATRSRARATRRASPPGARRFTSRGVPDIAFQASSATGALVYLSLPPDGNDSNINQTGWYDIGGTSLSCPQWAGLVAIADQINKAKYGQTGLGMINPALYKLASTSKYSTDFFDVATMNDNQEDPSIPG